MAIQRCLRRLWQGGLKGEPPTAKARVGRRESLLDLKSQDSPQALPLGGDPTGMVPDEKPNKTLVATGSTGSVTAGNSKSRKPARKPKDGSKTAVIAEVLGLSVGAFLLSSILNASIEGITGEIPTYFGLPLLLVVILVGILGDGIGLASARAKEERLLSMASRRVAGAKEALWFVRNAPRVSSVFSDLLGDVAATLSGAIAVALSFRLGKAVKGVSTALLASIGVGVVSAMTVGGKALFKPFALRYAEAMILSMGRTRRLLDRVLGGRQKHNER